VPSTGGLRQGESDEIVITVQHHQQGSVFAALADAGRVQQLSPRLWPS
jgi:hypothetical protein